MCRAIRSARPWHEMHDCFHPALDDRPMTTANNVQHVAGGSTQIDVVASILSIR
jgi:hypothetical protein